MSKGKHVPIRTCVACRSARPKAALIRIARAPEGRLAVDERALMPGRGAYVCPTAECVQRVARSKKVQAALREPLPPEQAERLAALAASWAASSR